MVEGAVGLELDMVQHLGADPSRAVVEVDAQ
jgi:hypothetical protein